jgi:hypothetical protein
MGKNKHRASRAAELSALITAPTSPPPQEALQEKTMEASQEKAPEMEAPAEQSGPTAKEMAKAEEVNQLRMRALAEQADKPPAEPDVNVIEVAARGYDALQEAFAKHNAKKPPEYIPPPRTARQMSALEEELEAGRRSQQRAEAQKAAAPANPTDTRKEGFSTPVFRPGDVVPDPTIPAAGGFAAGNRVYGSDA